MTLIDGDRRSADRGGWRARTRAGLLTAWAAVTGAAPHVLHHVGPLAGAAVLAGAAGRIGFGLAGFAATIPMLRRLRRRTGGWRVPALALAAFALVFTLSNLVLAPAITGTPDAGGELLDERGEPVDHHGHQPDEEVVP